MRRVLAAGVLAVGLVPPIAHAVDPVLSPDAPKDRPMAHDRATMERAIAPYVAQARASYPAARARYLAGLPRGQSFFVTTRLRDGHGHVEQVFVAVDGIQGTRITGRIWSDILGVEGYRRRDPIAFDESELVDWLISRPDGSEEGNVVGKFLDTYQR